ncbi:rhomboid family intramembrane serine protease [Terrihabitans soli]|uniref:Rhomboid family intramembrane serine protease n=1 Tax=Terrihabitans soli TaxID=708113 RepID=A0A6S6QSY7_9HYPH|nr:rhomboid family intramembrane serine protease [Terrihabitans soli]BCJ89568.1 rhomboid family intramembrane serine protease [Terrihabitans soli]
MVFVPFSDDNPRLVIRTPYVSWGLIALNALIFCAMRFGLSSDTNLDITIGYGMIPALLFGDAALPDDISGAPAWATLFTSLFLHGDPIHLIGNLLFIFVFADNIEDSMGHWRFIVFYLLCGAAGGLAHAFAMPASEAPLIGASSSIAGVIAAYLLLHPRVKVWIMLFARIPLRLTAVWIIAIWILVQGASLWTGIDEATGWWAHLGGFVAGGLLIALFKRTDVPWFGRAPKTISAKTIAPPTLPR